MENNKDEWTCLEKWPEHSTTKPTLPNKLQLLGREGGREGGKNSLSSGNFHFEALVILTLRRNGVVSWVRLAWKVNWDPALEMDYAKCLNPELWRITGH